MGILKIVKFWTDQRVDIPDRNAISVLAEGARRVLARIMGQPRVDPTDVAYSPGCVLVESSVSFATPNVTLGSGLKLLCASDSVSGAGPYGDYLELEAGLQVANGCPVASPGVTDVLIMARATALTDGDTAARMFYDTASTSKTQELSKATRQWRTPDCVAIDAGGSAGIAANLAAGYQHVVALEWNGGSPRVKKWYSALPYVSNATRYPAGPLRSLAQGLAALAAEIRTMKSAAPTTTWDSDLADPDATLAHNWGVGVVLTALTGNATCGNMALNAKVNSATIGNTALGALVNDTAAKGNNKLDARVTLCEYNDGNMAAQLLALYESLAEEIARIGALEGAQLKSAVAVVFDNTNIPSVTSFCAPYNVGSSGAARTAVGHYTISKIAATTSLPFFMMSWRDIGNVNTAWRYFVTRITNSSYAIVMQSDYLGGGWTDADPPTTDHILQILEF